MAELATLALWADFVRTRIDRLKADFPELAEDAELMSGMIEGETDFDVVIDKIVDAHLTQVSFKEAAELRRGDLDIRISRYGRTADALRQLALDLMQAAGKTMVRRPEATLSVVQGRKRVVIDDAAQIPQGFIRLERLPLKTEIGAALNVGEEVPGAHLEAGAPVLSIRTK